MTGKLHVLIACFAALAAGTASAQSAPADIPSSAFASLEAFLARHLAP